MKRELTKKERRAMNRALHRVRWHVAEAERKEARRAEVSRVRGMLGEGRGVFGLAGAVVRRRELWEDEEAAAELGCSVEELKGIEEGFVDVLRARWMRMMGVGLVMVRERRMVGLLGEGEERESGERESPEG